MKDKMILAARRAMEHYRETYELLAVEELAMTKDEMAYALALAETATENWIAASNLPSSVDAYLERQAVMRQRPIAPDGSRAWYPFDVIDIVGKALHDDG